MKILLKPLVIRGLLSGMGGFFIGILLLFVLSPGNQDGELRFFKKPLGGLVFWMPFTFPLLFSGLTITGAMIGWAVQTIRNRIAGRKYINFLIGLIIGVFMGVITSAIIARVLDYLLLRDDQLELYGYYFVKCAAIIGATSGAVAALTTGLSKHESG